MMFRIAFNSHLGKASARLFVANQHQCCWYVSVEGKRFRSTAHGDRMIHKAKDYISWSTTEPVKLRMEDSIPGNYPPMLVQTMMRRVVKEHGDRLALVSHDEKIKWTYKEYFEQVQTAAKGFIQLGLQPSHAVGIMGTNCPQWFVSSIASIFAGGLSCGIYVTNSTSTIAYICNHAPVDILVVEDMEMLEMVLADESLSGVKHFLLMHGETSQEYHGKVTTWSQFMELGKAASDDLLVDREANQAVNKACMLIYTSGTTGPPKAAMLSHDNVTWSTQVSMEHYEWEHEVWMSYLPLSHVAACLIDCYMVMYVAGTTCFADKNALKGTLVDNLRRIRPTKFLGVPRVWEKIQERMQEVGKSTTGVKKLVADWAKATATKHHTLVREGKIKPDQQDLQYRLAKKLVFSKIHEALGLDVAVTTSVPTSSAAAPLNLDTFYYFQSLDIVITTLLGCTETSGPQTTNMSGPLNKPGSEGKTYFGVSNRILNPNEEGCGEIATRSRNVFMGYQKDELKTKEAFDEDGWFRSGDIGRIDSEGFMWLSGRLKELIITAGGENIAPVPIEAAIKHNLASLVAYVVVVGDRRKYLACLLTLRCNLDSSTGLPSHDLEDCAIKWCQEAVSGCKVSTVSDVIEGPHSEALKGAIKKQIDLANEKAIAHPHRVQKFAILPDDLTINGEELGPTLKLKRHVITKKYKDIIDNMYHD